MWSLPSKVFIAPRAAPILDDKVLDVRVVRTRSGCSSWSDRSRASQASRA